MDRRLELTKAYYFAQWMESNWVPGKGQDSVDMLVIGSKL